jgi:large subunit ribosomal protein L25
MLEEKLQVEMRGETGKQAVKSLRRSGKIPAVVYGAGEETLAVLVDRREFIAMLQRAGAETVLIDLSIAGSGDRRWKTILREVQRHPRSGNLIHIDFQRISMTKKITVGVALHIVGEAFGVKSQNGILDHHLRQVEVRCLPADMPSHLEVDVSELRIGDTIHVSDLQIEGIEFVTDPMTAVASVLAPTVHVAAPTPAEEAALKEAAEGVEEGEAREEAPAGEGAPRGEGEGGKD